MRKVRASKVTAGMITRDMENTEYTVTAVSGIFEGGVQTSDSTSPARRWGDVVRIEFSDGSWEQVLASDMMYIYEAGDA